MIILSVVIFGLLTGVAASKDCDEYYSCFNCVSATSWTGSTCRWCPRTSTCHAYGSWVNDCSSSEDIKDDPNCCYTSRTSDSLSNADAMLNMSAVDDLRSPYKCSPRKDCDEYYSCSTCVSATSWSGSTCRWCPLTSTCHAYLSPQNICSRAEDIKDDPNCCYTSYGSYVSSDADAMLKMSAVAYDRVDPHTCMKSLLGSDAIITKIATANCSSTAFCGYVGISKQHKAIIVAFRGSKDFDQVMDILVSTIKEFTQEFRGMGEVQKYFKNAHDNLYPYLETEIRNLRSCFPSYSIWVTGHSLGGAIASLASSSIIKDNIISSEKLVSYTFGMPRVGKKSYSCSYNRLAPYRWRVTNRKDFVTTFPTKIQWPWSEPPYHHGVEAYYSSHNGNAWSSHKLCTGVPHGEDPSCTLLSSRNVLLDPHTNYFGIQVGEHCKKFHRSGRSSVWNPEFSSNRTAVYKVGNDGSYTEVNPHELEFGYQCPSPNPPTTARPTSTSKSTATVGTSATTKTVTPTQTSISTRTTHKTIRVADSNSYSKASWIATAVIVALPFM